MPYINVSKPTGANYTTVAKPTGRAITLKRGMTVGLLIPLTNSVQINAAYTTVSKPSNSTYTNIPKPI